MGTAFLTAGLSRAPFARPGLYGDGWELKDFYILPLVGSIAIAITLHFAVRGLKGKTPLEEAMSTPKVASAGTAAETDTDAKGTPWLQLLAAQAVVFTCALLFGLGLGMSGMTDVSVASRHARRSLS